MNQHLLPIGVFVFLAYLTSCALRVEPAPGPAGLPISRGIDQRLDVEVGPPAATLAVWVIEPAAGTPIRGTVIFLHGFMTSHYAVANAGEALRRAGYRGVLVDMRGFGESSGAHRDFGVTDARDLRQLVDELQKRGLCGETLGVYGTSMGAATAILFAAEDPRVTSVVAVAPFADIRTEVPSYGRAVLGTLGLWLEDSELNLAADVIGSVVDWDLDGARPIDAIRRTKARVLLIHGDADDFVPHAASEALHAAAPERTRLTTLPNRGHIELCFDISGELRAPTRQWFDDTLMPH